MKRTTGLTAHKYSYMKNFVMGNVNSLTYPSSFCLVVISSLFCRGPTTTAKAMHKLPFCGLAATVNHAH